MVIHLSQALFPASVWPLHKPAHKKAIIDSRFPLRGNAHPSHSGIRKNVWNSNWDHLYWFGWEFAAQQTLWRNYETPEIQHTHKYRLRWFLYLSSHIPLFILLSRHIYCRLQKASAMNTEEIGICILAVCPCATKTHFFDNFGPIAQKYMYLKTWYPQHLRFWKRRGNCLLWWDILPVTVCNIMTVSTVGGSVDYRECWGKRSGSKLW